ncbi:MAG: GlyGly-CTERM sorting domain-containing protein [Limisphaerales bacterium]
MHTLLSPMLGDIYWVGGGSIGLLLLIVLIVLLVRRGGV